MATTLEAIHAKMKKLQAQADALITKKAQSAVDQIWKLMMARDLTIEDMEAKARAKRQAKTVDGSASKLKAKVANSLKRGTPPKYLHPKTGATWTGHVRARPFEVFVAGADTMTTGTSIVSKAIRP